MERRRPLAPPATKTPLDGMPFKPGQVLGTVPLADVKGAAELTESELTLLTRGGFSPGDPLPDLTGTMAAARLRQHVADVVRDAEDIEGLTPVDPTSPPLPLKPMRDISTLSPSEAAKAAQAFKEVNELRDRIQQAREQSAVVETIPDHMAAIPGYLEAMSVAQQPPTVELVDDIGLNEARPRLRRKQSPEVPPPQAPVQTKSGIDINSVQVTCPRCQFDLKGELFLPTVTDKISYMALVMGDQKRFRRKAELFDGRITVIFRSLLTSEEHLAMAQVDEDAKLGKISNLILYTTTLEDYKLVMSIESVQRKGKPPVEIAPIADYEFDDKRHRTALPEFREWVDDEILNAGSLRRAINRAYFEFNQILQMIEAHAPDSDFFAGIA